MTTPGANPPAGWYPDPGGAAQLRWWDGTQWTAHVSQAQPQQPPQQPPHAGQWGHPYQPYGQQPQTGKTHDTAMRWVLPVDRSPWAIAAGYAGLLSPLLCVAPFAVVFGVVALFDIKKTGTGGSGRAWFGIVMGLLCSVGLFLLALPTLLRE